MCLTKSLETIMLILDINHKNSCSYCGSIFQSMYISETFHKMYTQKDVIVSDINKSFILS